MIDKGNEAITDKMDASERQYDNCTAYVRLIDANEVHRLIDQNLDINKGKGCSLSETLVREIVDSTHTIDPESLRPQWISVKDRLPDVDTFLGISRFNVGVQIYKVRPWEPGWSVPGWEHATNLNVHYWMPLPEPPKEA